MEWQEELDKTFRRLANLHALVTKPEPKVGQTPREEVYKKNKSRLYRYASSRRHATPLLFVPNLGISRPYIFDLLPGGSFIEHMTREGFDFYLLDWGVFGPEDNDLTVEDCVTKILPKMAAKVLESSGAPELSVLGYCMGAPISASFIATRPEVPVRNFVDMAGPIDFAKVGLFGLWLKKEYFNVDRFVDTLGSVPADLVQAGFKLIKPTMDLSTNLNLWWNLWNDEYVKGFQALNRWANEYVAFPGEFFRQWVRPPGAPREHHLSGLRRRRQGRLHRPARVRAGARRRRRQQGEGVRRAARRPHLTHRRARGRAPLLAEGLGLARAPLLTQLESR
ncbi:MAG: hypothetical protein AUH26_08835 [Candidatus Rokubacteria bacterium 13_1_40CM_69_96]|nr:MAG: hypothetical protein AUH26_08835 [Candidatus Rokubacteria bacterium 13_1_40CM_69_96]